MDVIRGYKYEFNERDLVCVNWEKKKNETRGRVLEKSREENNLY